ncbi:Glucose-6-phosphate isomerase [Rubripirellula tenax]|uniref:Glucose-6-phosphate isomerase n=1 Tax=Rubripirellula tenax TaxID=2528015 RepID=A0A5C6EPE0_9BACT|nr:glucose-6-phosphate isomerase [Rubripirellula tenax]TWU50952.1 Glucose-6-phosphate isomerase [Rubripirellula tenax]
MSLLRFDAAGCISDEWGIQPAQTNALAATLLGMRNEWTQHPSAPFFRWPENQFSAYLADRTDSELGRVFKVANGLHDHIDAVVVIGTGDVTLGVKAMRDACSDPYHNELSRAARGSKPRMYFAGDRFDNDATASLIHRITEGGYGDSPAEKRWAIVVIDPVGQTPETAVALRQFVSVLERSLGGEADAWLPRLLIPITSANSRLDRLAAEIGCQQVFSVPPELGNLSDDLFRVLSPVGLLPAAMLGLDCVKLLEGAAAINDHFIATDYADNLVLKQVAVEHVISKHRGHPTAETNVWVDALKTAARWRDRLNQATTPSHGKLINHITVDQDRQDRLVVGKSRRDQDHLNAIGDQTLTTLNRNAIQAANDQPKDGRHPTTQTIFPTVDTFVLGQWFQMSMIARALRHELSLKT